MFCRVAAIVLALSVVHVQCVVENSYEAIDKLFDEAIYLAEQYIQEYHLDIMPMPTINVTYKDEHVGSLVINGYINAENGTLVNATSLHRTGHGSLEFIGENRMDIAVNVTFDRLLLHYDVFNFKLWLGSNDGGIDVGVTDNEFHIKVTMIYDETTCSLNVDDANATKLQGFDIHLLPSGFTNYFKNKAFNVFLNENNAPAIFAVNSVLKEKLQNAVNHFDFCSYLKFLKKL